MGRSPSFCLHPSKLLKFNRICYLAPLSGREIARQLERPVADADEAADASADGFEKTPHLAVAAFLQHHAIPAIGASRSAGIDRLDALERGLPVVQLHASPQPFHIDRAVHPDLILALQFITRVHEPIGELTVVGEKEEPRAIQVEAANRDPAARREARKDSRPAFRIAARDQLAFGLVVDQDAG